MAYISKIEIPNVTEPFDVKDSLALHGNDIDTTVTNTSNTKVASAGAVKTAYDKAVSAETAANSKTQNIITMNGATNDNPTFYAPTSAGTEGYYLKSNGSGAPIWAAISGSGSIDIVISSSQPSGQKSGDFWYEIIT